MNLMTSYIVDDKGKPQAVVIDYEQFRKIERLLWDFGLGKAMEEVEDDVEVDLDEAKKLAGFLQQKNSKHRFLLRRFFSRIFNGSRLLYDQRYNR